MLRDIPEDRRSHLHQGGCVKSRMLISFKLPPIVVLFRYKQHIKRGPGAVRNYLDPLQLLPFSIVQSFNKIQEFNKALPNIRYRL